MTDPRTTTRPRRWLAGIAIALPLAGPALAKTPVNVTGSIYAAIPCIIQGNNTINVPFGDVQTTRIDGTYKTVDIVYGLNCSNASTNALRMRIHGNEAGFDGALAVPSHPNLGIAFKRDDIAVGVNQWFDFNAQKPPVLQAVPVKRQGGTLQAGTFSAGATLVVDYR